MQTCGVVSEDVVARIRKVQVLVNGDDDTAIMAHWVSDGID